MGGVGGEGWGYNLQWKQRHLGVWSRGQEEHCGFELSFELGFCCSIACRVREFIPCDRAQMGKSALALELTSLGVDTTVMI